MPRRRRKTRRKRTFRRRRKRRKRRSIPLGLFAKTKKISLRYVEAIGIDAGGSGLIAYHTFSANNLRDPNITGVGHQPLGFNEYMEHYNHYNVIGCKIKCTFTASNAGTLGNANVGIMQSGSPIPAKLGVDELMESKVMAKWRHLSPTGVKPVIISKAISLKKCLGPGLGSLTRGTASVSPTEQWYFHVVVGDSASGDPAIVYITVQMDFIVLLTERKLMGGS